MKSIALPITSLLASAALALSDGIPVDRKTNTIIGEHTVLDLNESQQEEIETLGSLTLTTGQWRSLRAVGPSWPKRFDTVVPVTWNDCTCGMDLYAIQLAPDRAGIPHGLIQDPDPPVGSGLSGRAHHFSAHGLYTMRVDRRGQFYMGGCLIPFTDLLEIVDIAMSPKCGAPAEEGNLPIVLPVGLTWESPVVKSRLERLSARAREAATTVRPQPMFGKAPVLPWDGGAVTIHERAFAGCATPPDINLPDAIVRIGPYAFQKCMEITSVRLPAGLREIDNGVFSDCASLRSVALPDSVTRIGSHAFARCAKLRIDSLPASLVRVDDYAFMGCASYAAVVLPSRLSHVGVGAFSATSLEQLIVPPTVRVLGDGAFFRCESLRRVDIQAALPRINEHVFMCCRALESIRIPDSVTELGAGAFHGCASLSEINLPPRLTSIEDHAFQDCASLKSLVVPPLVTKIGERAFADCETMTSITLPDSLREIGDYAFWCCRGLESIVIPDGVKAIGDSVFRNCTALKTVTLRNGKTKVLASAFEHDAKVQIVRP